MPADAYVFVAFVVVAFVVFMTALAYVMFTANGHSDS